MAVQRPVNKCEQGSDQTHICTDKETDTARAVIIYPVSSAVPAAVCGAEKYAFISHIIYFDMMKELL
jgi:hypothetical protein